MEFTSDIQPFKQDFIRLFKDTFTTSEGADEGALVGKLASDLLKDTPAQDLYTFAALDVGKLAGGVVFSRLTYADDPRTVFVLSPMAVATDYQRKGIGQALISHALAELKDLGVEVVMSYGDPAYYGKVGFAQISEDIAAAPLKLSFPHGWIGQSLVSDDLTSLKGTCTCVSALNNQALW